MSSSSWNSCDFREQLSLLAGIKTGLLTFLLVLGVVAGARAAVPPPADPTPDPGGAPNIFYGSVPPNGQLAPVIVFIPGLGGTASDWWAGNGPVANDMYDLAYQAGYRTAFVSESADNSRNNDDIQTDAAMLTTLLPQIAARYVVPSFYVVAHSKGNLDLQMAMMNPNIARLVRAVFAISCPCQGSALADWAAGPGRAEAQSLGLLTPGVLSLQTANVQALRAKFDPVFAALGITFYTLEGSTYTGNALTTVTGVILGTCQDLCVPPSGGFPNDGLVTVTSAQLPASYALDLGTVPDNHFDTKLGDVAFPKINAELQGLEMTVTSFRKVATNGFGDPMNTWAWSMIWFNGKLYVGTGRGILCLTLLTADVQIGGGLQIYPGAVSTGNCPAKPDLYKKLQAEIWQYTPETQTWVRVYQSPDCIPIALDSSGAPTTTPIGDPPPFDPSACVDGATPPPLPPHYGYTARDIGFRGMYIYTEADGTKALYVGGVTSGSIYDDIPPYTDSAWPSPRLLRTTDGEHWADVTPKPAWMGGNLANQLPGSDRRGRSFRGLAEFDHKMYATVANFPGNGFMIASPNPSDPNSWTRVSPIPENLPVWYEAVFNNALYITTGDHALPNNPGYAVYKLPASPKPVPGSEPESPGAFGWLPVVTNGACESSTRYQAPDGLSMAVFKNQLYVGTNRPTELIRINPDDTWQLVVGQPRVVGPECNTVPTAAEAENGDIRTPITGMGSGFTNIFTGHFWKMNASAKYLYLGTWNWSVGVKYIPILDTIFRNQFGFDLYRTTDGVHWSVVTHSGFNDQNYGAREIESTPLGVFVGSATPYGGLQIYQEVSALDFGNDGSIDNKGVASVLGASIDPSQTIPASTTGTSQDLNSDGVINVQDARILATQCTTVGCGGSVQTTDSSQGKGVTTFAATQNGNSSPSFPKLPSPTDLTASPQVPDVSPEPVTLTWNAVPGAVSYRVYRSENKALLDFIPPNFTITLPGLPAGIPNPIALPQDALNGSLDGLCAPGLGLLNGIYCVVLQVFKAMNTGAQEDIAFPLPAVPVATTTATTWSEPDGAPTEYQSLYFVQAQSADGRLSDPSNIVGAPARVLP